MKLHNYQKRIVEFCKTKQSNILTVEMGLGKTSAVLHYIDYLQPKTCIIVAPKRVALTVWKQEAFKWNLSTICDKMIIVSGTPKKRLESLENGEKPYKIISRDNLKDIEHYNCDLLVLDELTSFKNWESNRSQFCNSIIARQRIGLTGTFLANGAIDIYGQAVAVGAFNNSSDKVIKSNFYKWRASYFRDKLAGAGLAFQKWEAICSLETILEPIKKNIFTLSSEDWLDIPEVEYFNHEIDLTQKEMNEYLSLQSMLHLELDGEHYSVNENAKFCKLQTLCNGFIYLPDQSSVRGAFSTKLEAVADFCEQAVNEGESVLLFYAFREEAIWLSEMLKQRGLKFCSPTDSNFIQKWESKEIDILMAHPASASHGLNLQHGGRICVWSSLTYNFEYFAQANARLARQGQKKGVQIHVFSAAKTVEKNQYLSLMKKSKENNKFIEITK